MIDKDLVMKRNKLFSVLVLTLFLSGEAYSQSFQFRGGTVHRNDPTSARTTSDASDGGRVVDNGTVCQANKYIKLSYLKSIFTTDPDDFRVSINSKQSQLKISVPGFISNCLDLQFKVEHKGSNNVTVRAYNANYEAVNDPGGNTSAEQPFQKYVQCLKDEGVIKEVSPNVFEFDRDGPKVRTVQAGYRVLNLGDLNPKLDPKKDVNAFYQSPNSKDTGSMGAVHPADNAPNYGSCYWAEHFNQENQSIAYLSPDSRAARNVDKCKDSFKNIMAALASLDRSVLGNYDVLRETLETALVETLDEEAQEIYKKMEKLKKKVTFENGVPDVDEDEASDIMEAYANEMRNLNLKVLEPYLKRMDQLMTELENTSDEGQEAKIKERIKTLKKKIAHFSDKTKTLGYNDMMKLGRYYGLTADARVIEGFRLKSLVYGNMGSKITHPTKKQKVKVTFASAEKIINDAVTHYDKKISDVWETEAAVRSGDASAVRAAQNRHTALSRARDERFKGSMEKIQSDYKSCVGWFYTQYKIQKCQQKAQNDQKRAMAQRAYYNRQIGQASTQYNHYMGIYQTYQRSLASTDGTSTFDDPFGIYQDPFGSFNMDPMNYYNMGVGNTMGGANFNPFGNAGLGMNSGMGMMPGYNMPF